VVDAKCKKCRYSATCLTYPDRWSFVYPSGLELTRCKKCGRVWDASDARVGEKRENGSQMLELNRMVAIPTPPCGEWRAVETTSEIDRCLACVPKYTDYCNTKWDTATNPNTNYKPFLKLD
jgi:hypothetical protein